MRIAYVEDNATNLALVERIARMTKHIIENYTEGEEALEALKIRPYDLILMDIELAGTMNGIQVIQNLREFGLKTPIVALTAYAMMGDRDRLLAAGCDDYISKPLPINDFLALLNRYEAKLKDQVSTPSKSTATPDLGASVLPQTVPTVTPAPILQSSQETTSATRQPSTTPSVPAPPLESKPSIPSAPHPATPPAPAPTVETKTTDSAPPIVNIAPVVQSSGIAVSSDGSEDTGAAKSIVSGDS